MNRYLSLHASMPQLMLVVGVWLFAVGSPARADEFRPAYLQLSQVDATTYDVLWKIPAVNEWTTLPVSPQFPAGTEALTPVRSAYAAGVAVMRWRIRVPGALDGRAVMFSGLSTSRLDVLVRLKREDGTVQLERVALSDPRFLITASPGAFEVARTYTVLGIEHILSGFDHLLFLLALLVLVDGTRRLIATVTAFTLAHSLTLAGAALGFVNLPGRPVEAAIALSIAFVAAEIVHARQDRGALTQRYPWLVAFAFGLLHGFGFAGALSEIGLPQLSIPTALLFFNVGVEIGQLLFIATVLLVITIGHRVAHRIAWRQPDWLWRVPPYAIGSVAMFWIIQRMSAY
jgi:hydrogenase/urease accessory protein HupE